MNWVNNFFQIGPIPSDIMTGEYNLYLVTLSYIIATLASYVALDMSTHLRRPSTMSFRIWWLIGGAFVMGSGIWSMHFVGMLSFIMPMTMTYDLFWTGLSMLVACLAAAGAFIFFMIKNPTTIQYILGGIILGAAIPSMHYTGMTGMENVRIHYLPGLFILSVIIAIVAACAAVWFAVHSDKGTMTKRTQYKFISALIMGFAICGMHYVGMEAAIFTPTETHIVSAFSLDPKLMAIFITTTVISIMAIALILSTTKYYISTALKNEKDFLEVVLNNIRGALIASNAEGKITLTNKTGDQLFGSLLGSNNYKDLIKKLRFLNLKTHKELDILENPLNLALKGADVKDQELISIDKNGNERIVVVDGQPLINSENERIGAVIVCHDITERKQAEFKLKEETNQKEIAQKKLDKLNQELIQSARRAGMAEIATNVLHNIGNIMNSVNVSTSTLQEQLNSAQFSGLVEIGKLIQKNQDDLNKFVKEDPQGKNFVNYLIKIGGYWEEKKKFYIDELNSINKYVQNIKEIIVSQQSLSVTRGFYETISLNEIIEDSIKLVQTSQARMSIVVERDYSIDAIIHTDKSKLMQILVNLLRNAFDSLLEANVDNKIIRIVIAKDEKDLDSIAIKIIDNGQGIHQENITKIFSFGFTTKQKGHGFGLHSSALLARELGGSLSATSKGKDQGSTFTLILPIKQDKNMRDNI